MLGARTKGLFKIAEKDKAPLAIEAVRRIDAIFEAERVINGTPDQHRLAVRQESSAPMVEDLFMWMRTRANACHQKIPLHRP
jgi:hypothetical protein